MNPWTIGTATKCANCLMAARFNRLEGSGGGPERMKVWDLPLLLQKVQEDPSNGHYWYYLAQTYRDMKMIPEAVAAFNHRAEMGGMQSLVYWCRFQVAEITQNVDDYIVAWSTYPERQEALHRLAAIYNAKGCFPTPGRERSSLHLRRSR